MVTLQTLETLYRTELAAYMACVESAFALVKPHGDWKAPIATTATKAALIALGLEPAVIAHAVTFYTATECEVTETADAFTFKAAGYRLGPAGP